jgi:hypothetical protein
MKHFDMIGKLDVQPILNVLPFYHELWNIVTFRQSALGSPHVDTKSIYLRMPVMLDRDSIFNSLDVGDLPTMQEPEFADAVKRIARLAYAEPARAMLVALFPGGTIKPHTDEGFYAESTDRYHWCITSNDKCSMKIGNEIVHAQPEEVYWFDKHSEHTCCNKGNTPRIHLICDMWKD